MSVPLNFVVFQSTYKTLTLGLFRNGELCQRVSGESKEMSATLLIHFEGLLKKESLTFRDLAFIGVYVGPGPFTSIRSLVAYANGLAFSSGVMLVEIDGFDAFFKDFTFSKFDYTALIFNAFGQEFFYAIRTNRTGLYETGILSRSELASVLLRCSPLTVQIAGQGVGLFLEELEQLKIQGLVFDVVPQEAASIEAAGLQALKQWQDETKRVKVVFPRHLKQIIR